MMSHNGGMVAVQDPAPDLIRFPMKVDQAPTTSDTRGAQLEPEWRAPATDGKVCRVCGQMLGT